MHAYDHEFRTIVVSGGFGSTVGMRTAYCAGLVAYFDEKAAGISVKGFVDVHLIILSLSTSSNISGSFLLPISPTDARPSFLKHKLCFRANKQARLSLAKLSFSWGCICCLKWITLVQTTFLIAHLILRTRFLKTKKN